MNAVVVAVATALMAVGAFSLAWLRDRRAVRLQRRRVDGFDD